MFTTNIYRNALAAGTMLLEYRLESVLGAGGFGMTYLARDVNLDKAVAIKEYFPTELAVRALDGSVVSTQSDGEFNYKWGLDRFLQEARTLAKFSHPHIVRVNRYFEAHATGYMVMDYEDGESLQQFLKHDAAPGEARIKQLLGPLLDGLRAVHGAGFLHRDIKPSNIFMRSAGTPVLIDFGSARQAISGHTKTLTSVLTPGYAPLEQYAGDGNQGPWTDIYAMGGVLYRAMVGDNPPDAVSRIKNDTVPPKLAALRGRVSQATIGAIEWAMALDEKSRPQTVDEWRGVLDGKAPPPVTARLVAPAAATRMIPGVATPATGPAGAVAGRDIIAPVSTPASPRMATRRAVAEESASGWRWVGVGLAALLLAGGAHEWNKRGKAKELAAQEEARAAQERQAEEKRQMAQQIIDQRMAMLREKEKIAADRAEALRQLDQDRARERERERERDKERAAPPQSAGVAPPAPAFAPPGERPPEPRGAPDVPFASGEPMVSKKEADFRRSDLNGDGFLSREEAVHMPNVPEQFGLIDTNGDGRISLAEFMAWKPFPKPGGPLKK